MAFKLYEPQHPKPVKLDQDPQRPPQTKSSFREGSEFGKTTQELVFWFLISFPDLKQARACSGLVKALAYEGLIKALLRPH